MDLKEFVHTCIDRAEGHADRDNNEEAIRLLKLAKLELEKTIAKLEKNDEKRRPSTSTDLS